MAVLVDGTVYTVVGSQDFIDLQVMQEDGVSPRDLTGNTDIKVRLQNDVDGSTIIFTKSAPGKVIVLDDDDGTIRIKPAGTEYTIQSVYTYYVDVIDVVGSHPVPMKQELRQKWHVAAKIGS